MPTTRDHTPSLPVTVRSGSPDAPLRRLAPLPWNAPWARAPPPPPRRVLHGAALPPSVRHSVAQSSPSPPGPSAPSSPCPRPKVSLATQTTISTVSPSSLESTLTRRRQHLFSREHRIRTRQKTHRLLILTQRLSPSRKPDNRRRHHNPCRRNRAQFASSSLIAS